MNALLALIVWILTAVGGYTPVEACQVVRSGDVPPAVCVGEVAPQEHKSLAVISNGF